MIRSVARFSAAALILASAAGFAIGVVMERHSEAAERAAGQAVAASATREASPTSPRLATTNPSAPTGDTGQAFPPTTTRDGDSGRDHDQTTTGDVAGQGGADAGGGADHDADGGHDQDADGGHEGSPAAEAERSELVFGLNLESPALVTAAVVVSVLFAIAILTIAAPWLAGVIAVAMLAFTVLDVREIVHQLGKSHLELAAVAVVVALLHLLAAVTSATVAGSGYLRRDRTMPAPS